jgi:hypothetical protein
VKRRLDLRLVVAELCEQLRRVLTALGATTAHRRELVVELHGSGREPKLRIGRVRHRVAVVDDRGVGDDFGW